MPMTPGIEKVGKVKFRLNLAIPIFLVEQRGRSTWAVVRYFDHDQSTAHMTESRLEAVRMCDELEKCDRRAFYEGLLIGRAEGHALIKRAV